MKIIKSLKKIGLIAVATVVLGTIALSTVKWVIPVVEHTGTSVTIMLADGQETHG